MKSVYLANKLIDVAFHGVAYTPPAGFYVALFSTFNSITDYVEFSYTEYGRVQFFPSTVADGAVSNTNLLDFGTPVTTWSNIVGIGIFDELTNGNILYGNKMFPYISTVTGSPVVILANTLYVTDL